MCTGGRRRAPCGRCWGSVLALLVLCGCMRAYAPSTMQIAALAHRGGTVIEGQAGFHGLQANVAHAVAEHLAVRGMALVDPQSSWGLPAANGQPFFVAGGGGLGLFWPGGAPDASPPHVLRGGVSLDMAAGAEWPGTLRMLNAAVLGHLGAVWENGEIHGALRTGWVGIDHGSPALATPRWGHGLVAEPALTLRAGSAHWKAQAQVGFSFFLWRQGNLGAEWPLLLSLGVVYAP